MAKAPASKTILLIDIARQSVGVGVLILPSSAKPQLVAAWRDELHPSTASKDRTFEEVMRLARRMIDKASAAGYAAWDDVYCAIGTPWVLTQVRTLKLVREKQFAVTEKLMRELKERDFMRFIDRAAAGFLPFDNHMTVLDHELVQVRINGYAMDSFIGQRAREVECTYLLSGIDPEHYQQLWSAVSAVAHREPTIHSVQYALYDACRAFGRMTDYVIMDFHGGSGDCIVVRDGVIKVTASVDVSEQQYVDSLAAALDTSAGNVRAWLRLRSEDKLDARTADSVAAAEGSLRDAYIERIQVLLESVAQHGLLPDRVLVIHDGTADFLFGILREAALARFSVVNKPFTVTPVTSDMLNAGQTIAVAGMIYPDAAMGLIAMHYVTSRAV